MVTLREARASFFAAAGFDERNYDEPWVRVRLGPVPFAFPNTASRKRAVRIHDLHHALTGYDTSWRGEFSISAFEIASGCGRYAAAWVLDLGGLVGGAFLYPRATFRAFMRGRRSGNLYGDERWSARVDEDVDLLRKTLPIAPDDDGVRVRAADVARYVWWLGVGLALWLAPVAFAIALAAAALSASST